MNPASKLLYILSAILLAVTAAMLSVPVRAQTLQEHIDKYCQTDCITATQLTEVTARAAKRFGFDKTAMQAIIFVESKYHIKAKNGGSVGLTQALLRYHKKKFLGKNYFAVEDNVFAGGEVFRDCLARHKGDYPRAYSCYNGGGDKRYKTKVQKAVDLHRRLARPTPSIDPLGDFVFSLSNKGNQHASR